MAANNSEFLIVSATWGASAIGIATGFSASDMVEHLQVAEDGKIGPSARAPVSRDFRCAVTHLTGTAKAIGTPGTPATAASLVIVLKDMAGTSKTHTMVTMVPGSSTVVGQKQGLLERSQEFLYVGDGDSNPHSEA